MFFISRELFLMENSWPTFLHPSCLISTSAKVLKTFFICILHLFPPRQINMATYYPTTKMLNGIGDKFAETLILAFSSSLEDASGCLFIREGDVVTFLWRYYPPFSFCTNCTPQYSNIDFFPHI